MALTMELVTFVADIFQCYTFIYMDMVLILHIYAIGEAIRRFIEGNSEFIICTSGFERKEHYMKTEGSMAGIFVFIFSLPYHKDAILPLSRQSGEKK